MRGPYATASAALVLFASACGNGITSGDSAQGTDHVDRLPLRLPYGGTPIPGGGPEPQIGSSCKSTDLNRYCLSIRYVTYQDSSGNAVVSENLAISNVQQTNEIWSRCDIGFEIGEYLAIEPVSYGLSFSPSTHDETTTLRNVFATNSMLLLGVTGKWTGTLGASAANAWTAMPGGPPYGVVLEAPVSAYPNLIAHELGHYLNLGHVSDTSDVMNPVIYTRSTGLTASQCADARAAVGYFWAKMMR